MNITHRIVRSLALAVASLMAVGASAATLSVPYHAQRSFFDAASNNVSQWCWAASSQMIMEYFGVVKTQEEIADYGSGGSNHWNYLTGAYPASGTRPALNGIDLILRNLGAITTTRYGRALTVDELQKEIDANRPAVARLGWTGGGGHFVVVHGFDGTVVDINDPWPSNGQLMRTYANFSAGGAGVYTAGSGGHAWTHTLTVAASLDIVFLIDSTGSMSDDIANVKANAHSIITNINARFPDSRIAVVDYKDYPQDPYGDPGDYISNVRTTFTTNVTSALAAINSISASGGNDWPEAVYSALYEVIDGSSLGMWRTNPTQRIIVIMGDAPGHNPEPWPGGRSLDEVLAKATTEGFEITVHTLAIGADSEAIAVFQAVAGGTGGSVFQVDSAFEVAQALSDIVDQASASERFPRGPVSVFRPNFTFALIGDGMAAQPSAYIFELLKYNEARDTWSPYLRSTLKGNARGYIPKNPLPQGMYRWRLGFKRAASKIRSPEGSLLAKAPGGVTYENQYVEFERQPIEPGPATRIYPEFSFFSPTNSTVNYTFGAGVNASAYAVTISKDGRVWKRLTVRPPKKNPTAGTLNVRVPGHKVGESYSWFIQSLNYDYPKPE